MSRLKSALLATTLLLGAGGVAMAQMGKTYDPAQLPELKGKVAQYSLTPRGDVDGLILADGTEVHFPPFNSTQLVFAVRPGDAVTIHGLKARAVPMVAAVSITNDATGNTVVSGGPPHMRGAETPLEDEGTIKAVLHGPRGEANGVLMEDGTIVRLPPPEAAKLADQLGVGKKLYVKGNGFAGPIGRVIAARQIGADKTKLTDIAAPRGPAGGPMGGQMGGWGMHGHRGPGPHGPAATNDAPPPR